STLMAITLPSLSNRKLVGIWSTKYVAATLLSHPPLSFTWVYFILSRLIAFNQSFFLLSSETPNTSNPLSLYLLYNLTTPGLACLQGPHQLAQKSISTTF